MSLQSANDALTDLNTKVQQGDLEGGKALLTKLKVRPQGND